MIVFVTMAFRALMALPWWTVRRLRWAIGAWSKDTDRSYHDRLYSGHDYDPFCEDYPGYVTIRRFADHAEALLPEAGRVLDVGCGPGEITCELARRHPHLSFLGIDHSDQAIARARSNAARLGLTNVVFQAGDAERLAADNTFGLVLMFDAFHHLEHPDRFLSWLRTRTSRCLLIEPAGTVSGRWARHVDFDWLLLDMATIGERLEAAVGDVPAPNVPARDGEPDAERLTRGEGAVERRYALDDFERFFKEWTLRVTGTVSGFETYPPQPHARGSLRRAVGEAVYQMVKVAEERLVAQGRDGAAKHWVIAASLEPGLLEPRLPLLQGSSVSPPPTAVKSAYDVRYLGYDGPRRVEPGDSFKATVEIANDGWDTWSSDAAQPVFVSYHWLARDGAAVVEFNGRRSPLPRAVGPGGTCRVLMTIDTPGAAGARVLAIDLVKEGVTWFSETGVPWRTEKIVVETR